MKNSADHIVFAGGGTAGHLFPGLAVAELLRRARPSLRITFVGTGKPFEARHVGAAGFEYVELPCRPFPRRASEALRFVTDNLTGYYIARRFLREQNASLVVGLGGYASVPAARAANACRLDVILMEQNVVPGRATRWLAPTAALVCSSFDGLGAHLRRGSRVRVTGNPLRKSLSRKQAGPRIMPDRLGGTRRLLVLGGSGGAQTLNRQVPLALYKAGLALADWQIVHQSGERDPAGTRELYRKLGLRAEVVPFIEDLPGLLAKSHLAISRGGGTTLAELAASGVPAIVLPFPLAAGDHQRKNADVFAAAGAAVTLDERELEGRLDNHVARAVTELASNHAARVRMAQAMNQLARPEASRRVAKSILAQLERARIAV